MLVKCASLRGGDATFSGNVTITQPTNGSDAILNLTAKSSSGNSRTSSLTYDADTENLIVNNAGTNALTISSGGDVNIGSSDGLPLMHGSVAANASYCTYSFVNDPDTGMIRTGANTLALVTAGSSRLIISSAAKVGIGVSPDTNSKLTIKGSGDSGTSNSIAVYNFANSSIFTVKR